MVCVVMCMVLLTTVRHGVDVDDNGAEMRHLVLKVVLHGARDLVAVDDADVVVNRHVDLGPHPMSHPAGANLVHAVHTGNRGGR